MNRYNAFRLFLDFVLLNLLLLSLMSLFFVVFILVGDLVFKVFEKRYNFTRKKDLP